MLQAEDGRLLQTAGKGSAATPPQLPLVLATPKAMRLWQIAQREGWVDEWHQSLCTPTEASVLAYRMAEILDLETRWKYFEEFWNLPTLHNIYNSGVNRKIYETHLRKFRGL